MCNRTDCAASWAGPLACSVCRDGDMREESPCAVCGDTETDTITLHYSGDPWDGTPPYKVALCRDCQREIIEPVQEAVRRMREEREVKL